MDSNLLNRQYSVLVAGDVDLSVYDLTKQVEPYIAYEYNNRKNIHQQAINIYSNIIKEMENTPENEFIRQIMQFKLQEIQEMTDEEYFEVVTQGMIYDEKTGNALTTINPNGKYLALSEPTPKSAVPLIGDKFQCFVGDVLSIIPDPKLIEQYSRQWDSFMNESYHNKNEFINRYGNKETFISVMIAPFFYNAFVSNDTGWLEQGNEDQIQWILNFKKRFIEKLPLNTKLKILNFTK